MKNNMRLLRIFVLPVLLLFLSFVSHARGDEAEAYWRSVLRQIAAHIHGPNADFDSSNLPDKFQLRTEVIDRVRTDQTLAPIIRDSLKRDQRSWVREFAAVVLMKGLEAKVPSDELFMLSDPAVNVKGLGALAIRAYKLEDLECALPAALLSKDAGTRWVGIKGIREFFGWKGLPYYAIVIYDDDVRAASEAATGFRTCNREDAIPHLARYLQGYGKARGRKEVTACAIESLEKIYGESNGAKSDMKRAVDDWVKRLQSELGWATSGKHE